MAEFVYFAEALDGKQESKKGILTATDPQDAEKKVKAMFSHEVKVTLDSVDPSLTAKQNVASATPKIWHGSSTYQVPKN